MVSAINDATLSTVQFPVQHPTPPTPPELRHISPPPRTKPPNSSPTPPERFHGGPLPRPEPIATDTVDISSAAKEAALK